MVEVGQARLQLAVWTSKKSIRPRPDMVEVGQARLQLAEWISKEIHSPPRPKVREGRLLAAFFLWIRLKGRTKDCGPEGTGSFDLTKLFQ